VGTAGSTGTTKLELSNPTGNPINFSSVPGSDWLTIRPASGSIPAYQTFSVAVTADSTRVGAGIRSDVIRFPFSDGTVSSLNVVSITRFAGCTPTGLTVQILSLEQGFAVEAGGVANIRARVVDSCGNPRSTGALVARVSSEVNPVILSNEDEGLWSGSWTAARTPGNVQLTVAAAADQGSSTLTGVATVTGAVVASAGLGPLVDRAVNSAGYQAAGQISPGSRVSIFGDQLADSQIATPDGGPYTTELGGTRVTLGGAPLPLLSVDTRQVGVFIPFTVTPDTLQQLM